MGSMNQTEVIVYRAEGMCVPDVFGHTRSNRWSSRNCQSHHFRKVGKCIDADVSRAKISGSVVKHANPVDRKAERIHFRAAQQPGMPHGCRLSQIVRQIACKTARGEEVVRS